MTINEAKKEGARAFLSGRHRAPALNQNFLKKACSSKTKTAKLFGAYIYGWDIANLSENAIVGAPSIKEFNNIFESEAV